MNRVVITGLGFCTPVGRSVLEVWQNLLAGQSGIGTITLFDASTLPVRIGGEVKNFTLDALAGDSEPAHGERDRKIHLGLNAAAKALVDAKLAKPERSAGVIVVGVSLEAFFLELVAPAAQSANGANALMQHVNLREETVRLQTPLDRCTELLGARYGFERSYTNCSACAAGAQAVGEAFRRVRDGSADMALAGATDSALNPLGLGGFGLLRILSIENDEPTRACRPFDATRQGTVLSEGATFLVLENLAQAQARGARIYAEVIGYGASLDAYRVTDPEPTGRGAALSMTKAIADAGLQPEAIDAVNAHGTGTPKNDVVETLAIKQVLGKRGYRVPVTANKSMTGHMIANSGAFEAAVSALMLHEGRIPPTINLIHPDPECDLDYVAEGARAFDGQTVLSNSFGFGGQNATLIFRRTES